MLFEEALESIAVFYGRVIFRTGPFACGGRAYFRVGEGK